MAITLLVSANTPNPNVIGDWALMAAQVTACKQLLNTNPQILTEWETTTVPEIAKGTYIQHLGAIYIVDTANFPIAAGALAVGVNYIRLTTSGVTLTVDWAVSLAGYTWDYENNGLYNGASQILPYSITYAAAPTYAKYKIMNLSTNNAGDFILVDSDGRFESLRSDSIETDSIETDGTALRTKVIATGTWDITTVGSRNFAHGLTANKIRNVQVIIQTDAETDVSNLSASLFEVAPLWFQEISVVGANVALYPNPAAYDNANFNGTAVNRGWITITYEV